MHARTIGGKNYKPGTFTKQVWGASREYRQGNSRFRMQVEIRFDDECRNGYNTFAITCDIDEASGGRWREYGCGAAHEEIARVFPELAGLIKWHLCATDGPMHYVANTVYLAGDRDHRGRKAGEPYAWEQAIYFGNSPVSHKIGDEFATFLKNRMRMGEDGKQYHPHDAGEFRVVAIAHGDAGKPSAYQFGSKYSFAGFADKWHECPFDDERRALEWAAALNGSGCRFERFPTLFSEGKERDLEAARRVAVWPDATDEELSAEPEVLKAALMARLPGLIADFRADMESIGFLWEPAA